MVVKKTGPDKLQLYAREARECGLSYGKYMAIKDDPVKVAELKAKHSPRLKYTAEIIKANEAAHQAGPVVTIQGGKIPMGTGDRAVKLFELWKAGNSDMAIAKKIGVHYQTVHRWRNSMGLPALWHGRKPEGNWKLVKLTNGAWYGEKEGRYGA